MASTLGGSPARAVKDLNWSGDFGTGSSIGNGVIQTPAIGFGSGGFGRIAASPPQIAHPPRNRSFTRPGPGGQIEIAIVLDVVAIKTASGGISEATRGALERIGQGPLADRLRESLRRRHPRRAPDEIADAFQEAYARALRSCPVEDEPAIYAWLWRTMDNVLVDRLRLLAREPLVGSDLDRLERPGSEPTPERAVVRAEQRRELTDLFGDLVGECAPRQRAVLGLYVRGAMRPQVARELGVRERVVKRDLERILGRARALLVERCGGGCPDGSPLVWRFAFGLASTREATEAQLHLVSCRACQEFLERLEGWREAAAAVVPVPAAEQATPGLVERGAETLADLAGSVRERIGSPGSTVRQQAADAVASFKQQSASVYYRAVDPTPLAGMRPGAAAAAISACLALGAGATYCVDRGVAPLPDLGALLQQAQPDKQQPRRDRQTHRTAQAEPAPVQTQVPSTTEPDPTPEPTPQAVQPVVETTPAVPPPPPEQEQFDPAAAAAATATPQQQSSTNGTTTPAGGVSRSQPAAAPNTGVGEFLGGP